MKRYSSQYIGHVLAQPIMCPDSSFGSLLSACSACIAFLHLRKSRSPTCRRNPPLAGTCPAMTVGATCRWHFHPIGVPARGLDCAMIFCFVMPPRTLADGDRSGQCCSGLHNVHCLIGGRVWKVEGVRYVADWLDAEEVLIGRCIHL